jgi:hypothetical protein
MDCPGLLARERRVRGSIHHEKSGSEGAVCGSSLSLCWSCVICITISTSLSVTTCVAALQCTVLIDYIYLPPHTKLQSSIYIIEKKQNCV